MDKRLQRDFFARNTLTVARELLGKNVCRLLDRNTILRGKIVECEAYTQDEPSCHAYAGKTKRCEALFSKPGTLYVYFTYGMHYCANTVTDKEGYGSGVLIRAVEPFDDYGKTNGPARFCKTFEIDQSLNGIDITCADSKFWIEDSMLSDKEEIATSPRIGIKKALDLNWRFYIKGNKYVSK